MLASKDVAPEAFKKFRAVVEKESENKIKVLRMDRRGGGEFTSKQFTSYCEDTGIVRHFTALHNKTGWWREETEL